MPTVFVSENIERIQSAVTKFKDEQKELKNKKITELQRIDKEIDEIQEEIFRLEGCLITFQGFQNAGIEKLVPENEKETHNHEQEEEHNRNHKQEEEHHRNHEQKDDKSVCKNWVNLNRHLI